MKSPSLRILQIVHGFPPASCGGTEVYTLHLCRELKQRHNLTVVFPGAKSKSSLGLIIRGAYAGVDWRRIENADYLSVASPRPDSGLGSVFAETRPQVVHVQHLAGFSPALIREVKKQGARTVMTLHDYFLFCLNDGKLYREGRGVCPGPDDDACAFCWALRQPLRFPRKMNGHHTSITPVADPGRLQDISDKIYNGVRNRTSRVTWRRYRGTVRLRRQILEEFITLVDTFLCPSDYLRRKFMQMGFPEEKLHLVPYALPHKLFNAAPPAFGGRIRFGFIGHPAAYKGLDILLDAAEEYPLPPAGLIIISPVLSLRHRQKLKRLAARGWRITRGPAYSPLQAGRIADLYDVLVVPSTWEENSPLVVYEALLNKRPVIAADIGGLPELAQTSNNSLLVPTGDPWALAKAMASIAEQPRTTVHSAGQIMDMPEHSRLIEKYYHR